jgi:uncharacterized membrane protein
LEEIGEWSFFILHRPSLPTHYNRIAAPSQNRNGLHHAAGILNPPGKGGYNSCVDSNSLASRYRTPLLALFIPLVGLLLIGWLTATPEGLLGKADAVGYAVCHRIAERSFFLGDRPLPLCARCSGLYLGVVLGMSYLGVRRGRQAGWPSRPVLWILGGFLLVFAFDGINSYLDLFPVAPNLYEPQNWLRLVTGLAVGIGAATILLPGFNLTVWEKIGRQSISTGLRDLAILLLLGLVLALVVLEGNPLLLYPLALISAGGVLVVLTMVYSLIWTVLARAENRARRWSDLALPLVLGLGAAVLQIALLDLGRFWLTGTWEGFHFS